MAGQQIPNGFTGFSYQRDPFFESAGAALRSNAAEVLKAQASQPLPDEPANLVVTNSAAAMQTAREYARFSEDGRVMFDPEKLGLIPEKERRWSWVEIDLNAIRHNAMVVKRHIGPNCRLMAVVKADAYGHGAVECARTALNSGADYLGVATVEEAIALREGMVNAPVLVLAQPPASAIPLLLAYRVMPSIYTAEFAIQYAEEADALGLTAPYHLAVNTGMNRIGVRFDEVVEFLHQIAFHRALQLVGTFTHFATADCAETFDFSVQARHFNDAIADLRECGIDPGIVHAANSAAAIRYPEVHFDMVRLGISLYGFYPCPETRTMIDLRPAMSVHARITDMRQPLMSEGVSYGLHYRSPGSVTICTLPIGYADGLRRGLSGRTGVIVDGQMCPQVGNICMDQCMFEVDLRKFGSRSLRHIDPQVGDEVILVGEEGDAVITIDEMAEKLDTIQHEIAIGFSHRMPRIYV